MRIYTFPFHVAADEPALQETAKALAAFIEFFGPYPHQSLSVVEADFLNGMEYDGLIFLSHAFYEYYTGDQKSNLTIIAAHEVAHQWWYGIVGNDQANEPWLDEALSTYSELLFYEQVYPQLASWWQENRIDFHEPQGWVDSTIYKFGAQDFYPYRNAVYLRGALFLADLRQAIGDETFLAFLRDYLQQFSHRQSTGDDFFSVLSKHTDTDLSVLFATYFAFPMFAFRNSTFDEMKGWISGEPAPYEGWSHAAPTSWMQYLLFHTYSGDATQPLARIAPPAGAVRLSASFCFSGSALTSDQGVFVDDVVMDKVPANVQLEYVSPEGPVTLTIERVGNGVKLTWPQGTLLEAPDLGGSWTTNTASSPYTITSPAGNKFYKVIVK